MELLNMDSLEKKKLALLRILEILKKYSDSNHPLTQADIAGRLEADYGIVLERKAIGRNIALLKEAGFEIESQRVGCFLDQREFEDSELRMLIDGVLCSKYIAPKYSKTLIDKLCDLSTKYFRAHVKNIVTINDWGKTDNKELFYNIEIIDEAIELRKQIRFTYNKYGADKKLHHTSSHRVSPYQLVLHNQRYYLMALNERWGNMAFYRMDHITDMDITEEKITPVTKVEGYEKGINYKEISCSLPYLYTDKPLTVMMIADEIIADQILDWFGNNCKIQKQNQGKMLVEIKVSLMAMKFWAMQYINHVEIIKPESLRQEIREDLKSAMDKYK